MSTTACILIFVLSCVGKDVHAACLCCLNGLCACMCCRSSCAYSETCSDIRWLRSPDLEQLQSVCLLRATASARVKARGGFKCAAAFCVFSHCPSCTPSFSHFSTTTPPPSVCSAWATSTSLRRPRWASSALRAWPKWSWEWPAGESPTVTLSPSPTRVWCWRCSRTGSGSRYGSLLYSASHISIHFTTQLYWQSIC